MYEVIICRIGYKFRMLETKYMLEYQTKVENSTTMEYYAALKRTRTISLNCGVISSVKKESSTGCRYRLGEKQGTMYTCVCVSAK